MKKRFGSHLCLFLMSFGQSTNTNRRVRWWLRFKISMINFEQNGVHWIIDASMHFKVASPSWAIVDLQWNALSTLSLMCTVWNEHREFGRPAMIYRVFHSCAYVTALCSKTLATVAQRFCVMELILSCLNMASRSLQFQYRQWYLPG